MDRCRLRRAALPGARLLHAATPEPRAARWGELTRAWASTCPDIRSSPRRSSWPSTSCWSREVAARKVRALAAQATQTAGLIGMLGVDRYTAWVGEESYVEAARIPPAPSGSVAGLAD